MIAEAVKVVSPAPVPEGLLAAFDAYETALLTNDVATLDALFAPGPDTVRGDGTMLLVGHGAIAGFRSGRAVIPTRRVAELHVRPVADDAALVMASTQEPSTGATGLQTQLWQRLDGDWKITAAHVTLPRKDRPAGLVEKAAPLPAAAAPPLDRSVWRVVGTPLVAAAHSGPLDGVTVAVKDLFAVAGERLGAGNPTWLAGQTPRTTTAPAVSALLGAGAEVTGIARTDEFAYSLAGQNAHYGTTPNPAVPGGIGGGSTSGPASAVALGQVVVGLGTDTAGSIRVPASYQGLAGIRTTHGAISTDGVLPLAPSFDTVGWVARAVGPALRVAEVLLPDASATPAAAPPVRTVVLPTAEGHAIPDVAAACADRRAALVAEGLLPGAEVVDLAAETLEEWFAAFRTVQAFEAWAAHGEWITAHPGALGVDVGGRFAAAAAVTVAGADAARATVAEARARLREVLDGAVLVLPSSAGGAPARDASAAEVEAERAGTLRMTCLAGLAGAPAVSVPLLRTADGRPAGLCLVGGPGTDLDLLRLAATLEGTA
ncbi:AtzH-like domain-containing protein [Pseudonocardia halophobica]|uniref:AtzH-like domain-containing protein n=1 Tax=Pseudonocardia halophobica TaxID=29401 RepID=UPI003D9011C8